MRNSELQKLLQQYPDDIDVRITADGVKGTPIYSLDEDRIHLHSETAYVDYEAPEEEWNMEDGKLELGDGERFLVFMPTVY